MVEGRERVLQRLIETVGRERGNNAEQKVSQALDKLQQEAFILSHWPANSHEDRIEGIDHHLMTNDGDNIPFQIKSSQRRAQEARQIHPEIKTFTIHAEEDKDSTKRRLISTFHLKRREN